MSPTFTEDDIGKRVESAVGDEIGVITDIDGETAYIDPEPGMLNTVNAVFDWDDSADETVPLADDAVKNITEETVQLEQAAPAESITTDTDPDSDADTETDANSDADTETDPDSDADTETTKSGNDGTEQAGEKRDVEYSPGQPVESTVTQTGVDAADADSDLGTGTAELDDPVPETEGGVEDAEGRASETRHTADEAEPAQEVDPMGEIDDTDETDPERTDSLEESAAQSAAEDSSGRGPRDGGSGEMERADELDAVEEGASRDLEVDPSEVTDGDPEAEIDPREDVGQRTEPEPDADTTAGVDSESERPTTDGEESVATETGTDSSADSQRDSSDEEDER